MPIDYRMAEMFGLKLIKKQRFSDFFKENLHNKDNLSLLSTMQALEVGNGNTF